MKTVVIHYISFSDDATKSTIEAFLEWYKYQCALNIDGVIERFIPTRGKEGIETLIIE